MATIIYCLSRDLSITASLPLKKYFLFHSDDKKGESEETQLNVKTRSTYSTTSKFSLHEQNRHATNNHSKNLHMKKTSE